jgi:acetyltransferase-like isoleucine patch superfamily enzyme
MLLKYKTRQLTYALKILLSLIKCRFSTALMRLVFFFNGVELSSGSKFFGRVYLSIHPTASVVIGSNSTFRSAFYSNTIGLKQKCYLSASREGVIRIGNNCGLSGAVISAEKEIVLGDRVMLGANVTICDGDRHPLDYVLRAAHHAGEVAAITIGNDVWIGMNSIVLKGVTIGDGAVVAANSLVNKDIPSCVIAAGIPAKVMRDLVEGNR